MITAVSSSEWLCINCEEAYVDIVGSILVKFDEDFRNSWVFSKAEANVLLVIENPPQKTVVKFSLNKQLE